MSIGLMKHSHTTSLLRSEPLAVSLIILTFMLLISGSPATADDLTIYSDSLASGWENWSWSSTVNFANSSTVHAGSHSIAVTINAGWAALYLHSSPEIDLSNYEKISFWVHGGASGARQLRLVANEADAVAFTAPSGVWTNIIIPLSELGSPGSLYALYWQDTTNGTQPTFYLDDITLIAYAEPPPPSAGPGLTVNSVSGRRAINEDIYGMNYADEDLAAAIRLPVRRWGGNSTSRYNWQNDTYNTGSDWYFENIPADNSGTSGLPDGSSADLFVEQDRRTGTKTIMTIPMMGWVAKRRLESHPYDCGFKVSVYGAQESVDPWDTDCGNGVSSGGSDITGNDPTDTSVAIGPDFVSSWISHLAGRYGTAASGGVAYYNLDNEPMLWNSTHRDVHPEGTTYNEMRDLTYSYAAAIKTADPTAKTLGPVLWGWCAYFYSANDGCSAGSDYSGHGNMYFVPWYLQQMKTYEQQHGVRILDYLDLHNYPQANGVALGSAGSSATQALRLRSTRSLWDPTYIDESWIGTDLGETVRLIPRMRGWVNTYYPGTKLAITEYNWGGLESINGALAQADVLGIFGREGVDLATLWGPPDATDPGAFAFRIYRNYDGSGHGFGEMGVLASSTDQGKLSIYAAERSSDNALTVVVINKTSGALTSNVTLTGSAPTSAKVYRYSSANLSAIEHLSNIAISGNTFSYNFAANSITLFIMTPGSTTAVCPENAITIQGTSNYYTSIQTAYAATATDQTILMQAMDFDENPIFAGNINISLKGGYICDFSSKTGKSVISGSLTIRRGSVILENIIIR
jgi:hypothetical protein